MKFIAAAAGLALGLGSLALAPAAQAAPLSAPARVVAPSVVSDVACRTVTRRVVRPNGTVRYVRTRTCDRWRRPAYRERRYYHGRRYYRPAPRPGVTIRVNP